MSSGNEDDGYTVYIAYVDNDGDLVIEDENECAVYISPKIAVEFANYILEFFNQKKGK